MGKQSEAGKVYIGSDFNSPWLKSPYAVSSVSLTHAIAEEATFLENEWREVKGSIIICKYGTGEQVMPVTIKS